MRARLRLRRAWGWRVAPANGPNLVTYEVARAFFVPRFADLATERLCVAHLGGDGRVLGETAAEGQPGRVALPLRRLFADALRLDACAMLAAHNHPGGLAEPSASDLAATRRLAETADALGIRLQDHLILLPGGGAVSFRALGLL